MFFKSQHYINATQKNLSAVKCRNSHSFPILQISSKIRVTFEVILQQSAVKTRSRDVKKLKNNTTKSKKTFANALPTFMSNA